MLERLAHRGPDGEGVRRLPRAWLGHRRLAVAERDGGAQPLHHPDLGLWLVGEGEFPEEDRLGAEGADALARLRGTFALVLAGEDGTFVAARDVIGLAPLYWACDGDTVVFASELKAFDHGRRSSVQAFPPGHAWSPERGLRRCDALPRRPSAAMRARLGDVEEHAVPPEGVYAAIRDAVIAAVERRMVADEPVGTLLSGGLDSSIVTAIAAHAADRLGWRLPTFAVGAADSDDLAAARELADELGTDHHERVYTDDEIVEWVPETIRVIESFDPQLVHSAVPNLLVARLAAQHVPAVLIGEGADELFAGYAHYAGIAGDVELHRALLTAIEGLHAGGLQRVDRVAGANELQARVPFLDRDLVELGLALPARWKVTNGHRIEKWLLRRSFHGWLPDTLLWRRKAQFGEGTGAQRVLRERFGAQVDRDAFERERGSIEPPLRTPEEVGYYRIFRRHLAGVDPQGLVGRSPES